MNDGPPLDQWRGLDPTVKKLWRITAILAPLPFIPILAIPAAIMTAKDVESPVNPWLIAGILFLIIAIGTFAMVDARFNAWKYRLTDDDLATRSGIWWRSKRYVARHRIQHVDVSAGPIQRSLGLAEVKVFVAGGEGASIPGLSENEAERIRQILLKAGGLADPTPPPPIANG